MLARMEQPWSFTETAIIQHTFFISKQLYEMLFIDIENIKISNVRIS